MPFRKGQSGNPKGMKKGAKTRMKEQAEDVLKLTGELPGHFLARMMSDPCQPKDIQVECAKALMPFIHKKKPEAREHAFVGEAPDSAVAIEMIRRLLGA